MFVYKCTIFLQIKDGIVTLPLGANEVYTLTTLNRGQKGFHGAPPAPGQFPLNYHEDFESKGSFYN